jgi:PhnB protein
MTITPKLIVSSVPQAIDFYCSVFGANETERYTLESGQVVHATINIAGTALALAEEAPAWGNPTPLTLGGSAVLLTIERDDPDAACARAVQHGASVVIPLSDQFYGKREGRIRDPFGHLWILSKQLEQLTQAQIAERMAAWNKGRSK